MLVADAANVSQDGKANLLGVFEEIAAVSFPAMHPQLSVWMAFEANPFEVGRQVKAELRLVDGDGEVLVTVSQELRIPPPLEPGLPIRLKSIVPLRNTVFPVPGNYAFTLEVDGEEKQRTPLTVRQLIQRPPPSPS